MQKLFDFYENEVGRYKGERNALKKRMHLLSLWRIIVFTSTVLVVYLLRERTVWAILLAVAGTAIFLFLVRYYVDVKGKKNLTDVLLRINRTEIDVLNHRFDHLPDGREYMDPGHAYAHDLDLFGSGSFFQYINRTALGQGRNLLARLILANDIEAIPAKQETIDELAQMPGWRQDFTARAQLIKTHVGLTTIQKWLNGYTPFVPKLMRWLPWVFLGVSLILLALAFWFPQWGVMLIVWMGLGLMITGRSFKKISRLTSTSGKVQSTFGQYAKLLQIIETTDFASAQLRLQRQQLRVGGRSATAAIKRFSRLLDRMDYNNNVFYALFANGCFLGALQTAHALEQWINEHGSSVDVWFKTVAFFDAWNSLGNFAFNHPLYAYPIIQNGHTVLAATDAGHPIIPSEQNVHNDFEINDEEFLIVTGANMAGESTFFINVFLQNGVGEKGFVVFARKCLFWPL
ncbi:MAG: DNA mismatch repair protein MutS [Flavobacteriaceae bacterium]